MYHDDREEDTMENWDEEKLREAIEKKHGAAEKAMSKTDIVSSPRATQRCVNRFASMPHLQMVM